MTLVVDKIMEAKSDWLYKVCIIGPFLICLTWLLACIPGPRPFDGSWTRIQRYDLLDYLRTDPSFEEIQEYIGSPPDSVHVRTEKLRTVGGGDCKTPYYREQEELRRLWTKKKLNDKERRRMWSLDSLNRHIDFCEFEELPGDGSWTDHYFILYTAEYYEGIGNSGLWVAIHKETKELQWKLERW